ncbi:hypothetical protein ACWEOE_28300 [Amycolatopsis sp. NPDC004368]
MIRRVVAGLALVALAATACGVQPSGAISGDAAPSGPASTPAGAQPTTSIYLVADGAVVQVSRSGLNQGDNTLIDALAQGPTAAERASGLTTEVPQDAVPATVAVTPAEVTVRLSADVKSLSDLAVDQIVCTLRLRDAAPGARFTIVGGGNVRSGDTCA